MRLCWQDGTEGLLEALTLSEVPTEMVAALIVLQGELHTSKTRHNEEVDALHQELINLEVLS